MQTIRRTESETIRKEQILAVAQRVLREKGYDNSTISDIVKEAGVAQGTFYLYFDSKKAAVMELALKLMDEITLRLKPAMDPTLTFDQRMRLFIHVVFDVGSENVDLCRLAHLGVESPIEEVGASMPDSPMFLNIVRMMQVSIDSGEMKPINPDFAARLLMRLTSGAPTRGVLLQRRIRCGRPGGSVLADNHSRTCQLDSIRYSGVRLLNITRATRYHIRR
jgi:AcrR family transcriptional regulator